jgi:hypothetical protein
MLASPGFGVPARRLPLISEAADLYIRKRPSGNHRALYHFRNGMILPGRAGAPTKNFPGELAKKLQT